MTLPTPFREFIELLVANRVEFLVVGGFAVSYHGHPRYTGDLDLFVAISPQNSAGVVRAFREFGFTDLRISEEDFLDPDVIVEIGREPLKIQVMTGISGVTYAECDTDRVVVELDGLEVPFISYSKLIKNKRASGRAKDQADVDELESRRRQSPQEKP